MQDRNCILADEMGLGKTVQCVSFLAVLAETLGVRGPFLVVVPLSTVPNWIKEFRKWVPQVRQDWPGAGRLGWRRCHAGMTCAVQKGMLGLADACCSCSSCSHSTL